MGNTKCGCKLKGLGAVVTEIEYCPLHKAAPKLYEALKGLEPMLISLSNGKTIVHPTMMGIAINGLQALAEVEK